ncbi:hypothetical protein TSMEX_006286 [Taenia solium]
MVSNPNVAKSDPIYPTLQSTSDVRKAAINSTGFSVLLGPPLDSDCNLVNGWIRLGDPKNMQRVQLHQISYYCRILSFYATFVSQVADNSRSSLHQPIAAVSVVVQRKTILQGILVYLLNKGWKHMALVYDMHTTNLDIPETHGDTGENINGNRTRS